MGGYSTKAFVQRFQKELSLTPEVVKKFGNFQCEGKVFHIGLITDALIDASAAGYVDECRDLIDQNVKFLIEAKDGRSWRYFPGFDPLPHDADDLGQVAQVLIRADAWSTELLDPAFDLAIANTWEDGATNTWMLEDPQQRDAANKVWGRGILDTGKDPEVVANFLYASLLYDRVSNRSKLTSVIDKGVRWLTEQQQGMGFWRAAWYVGTCYSTYATIRLLSSIGGYDRAVAKALAFLAQAEAPDPLNRSMAVLAQSVGNGRTTPEDLEVLLSTQNLDGSWPAIPILDNHARVWGSETVTAAFCLKALLAASR